MGNEDMITLFQEQVKWLHEVDFGDFKRKVGLYLTRMTQSLNPAQLAAVRDLIEQLKLEIYFKPSGNIEVTRMRILELTDALNSRLRQH